MVLGGGRGRNGRKWKARSVKLTALRYSVRVLGYLEVRSAGGLFEGCVLVADGSAGEEVMLLVVVAHGLLLHERLLVLIEYVYLMALPFIRLTRHRLLIMAPRILRNYSLHVLACHVDLADEELVPVVLVAYELVGSDDSVGVAVHEKVLAELLGVVVLRILVFITEERPWTRIFLIDVVIACLEPVADARLLLLVKQVLLLLAFVKQELRVVRLMAISHEACARVAGAHGFLLLVGGR